MSPTVGFVSLGCPKALVDSEQILSQLRAEGYAISSTYKQAHLVIINTCGFINEAIDESLDAIGEAINECGNVVVTGCLGKQAELIYKHYPQVLAVTGPNSKSEVMQQVHKLLPAKHDPYVNLIPAQGIKLTPPHYAYIKISEGCNHKCSFCIIPNLRGLLHSRTIGDVLDEAEILVDAGVKELLIISQDTSAYGADLKYRTKFWRGIPLKNNLETLANRLGQLGVWIRFHYLYPYPNIDKLIPMMAHGQILPYLYIPLQHASPKVLKAMKRPAHSVKMLQRIQDWRAICPTLSIRSTFIVGFPGETDSDFEILLEFIREAQLDRVGCFTYSPVNNAQANNFANPIPPELKNERQMRLMNLQASISKLKLANRIGSTISVLVDNVIENGVQGRSSADAPDIDGQVLIETEKLINPGEIIDVRIVDSNDHDLFATLV